MPKVRAELNIERWPAMWQPSKSKTKAAVRTMKRETTLSDGTRAVSKLEVGFTQFGTITTEDQRMLYALVKQWEDTGKPASQIFFRSAAGTSAEKIGSEQEFDGDRMLSRFPEGHEFDSGGGHTLCL